MKLLVSLLFLVLSHSAFAFVDCPTHYPNGAVLSYANGTLFYPNGAIMRYANGSAFYPNGAVLRYANGAAFYQNGAVLRYANGAAFYQNGSVLRYANGTLFGRNGDMLPRGTNVKFNVPTSPEGTLTVLSNAQDTKFALEFALPGRGKAIISFDPEGGASCWIEVDG